MGSKRVLMQSATSNRLGSTANLISPSPGDRQPAVTCLCPHAAGSAALLHDEQQYIMLPFTLRTSFCLHPTGPQLQPPGVYQLQVQ